MYEQFKTRAEGVSAEVYRFESTALALDFIVGFLKKEGLGDAPQCRALWAACPFLEQIDRQALEEVRGLKLQVSRELAAEARFGISQMGWALADTGSLAQDATAIEQRLVSSLPAIHIALVPTSALLPDLPTLLTKVNQSRSGRLHRPDHRAEPDGGYRAGADHRRTWPGAADHRFLRRVIKRTAMKRVIPPLKKGGEGGFDFQVQRQIPLNPPLLKGDLNRQQLFRVPLLLMF